VFKHSKYYKVLETGYQYYKVLETGYLHLQYTSRTHSYKYSGPLDLEEGRKCKITTSDRSDRLNGRNARSEVPMKMECDAVQSGV
jgi:hypothetical protein